MKAQVVTWYQVAAGGRGTRAAAGTGPGRFGLPSDVGIDERILRAFSEENGFPLEPHLIVLALMGSKSHGTYMPPEEPDGIDDVDLMGFVVPPLEYHLGLPRWHHWVSRARACTATRSRRRSSSSPPFA